LEDLCVNDIIILKKMSEDYKDVKWSNLKQEGGGSTDGLL